MTERDEVQELRLDLQRLCEQIDAQMVAIGEQSAAQAAQQDRMVRFIKEHGDPILDERSRKLAVVRCGETGCGRAVATIYATSDGPIYIAGIRKKPSDGRLPSGRRPDELARKYDLPDVDPDLLDRLPDKDHDETAQDYAWRSEMDDFDSVEDLLEWENPDGPTWHPPLLARCDHHPSLWHLDREAVLAAVAGVRRGSGPVKLVTSKIGRPVS